MAGRPLRRAMIQALHDLGSASGYSGPHEDVALAYVLDWLSGAQPSTHRPTLSSLALYLQAQGIETSRPILSQWVNHDTPVGCSPESPFWEGKEEGTPRSVLYERVRQGEGADALVDLAAEELWGAKAHEHGLAKAKAQHWQWRAERQAPERWASKPQASAPTVIGSLHLHAVQRPPQVQIAPPPQGTGRGAGNGEYPTETRVIPTQTGEIVVSPLED